MIKLRGTILKHVSLLLTFAMIISITAVVSVSADQTVSGTAIPQVYELDNGYIKAAVSTDNGGFSITTSEGDRLNKADNNKRLLYHRDEYDTSFTSFEITDDQGNKKSYIFGSDYSFLGLGGNNTVVTADATGITAIWSVDSYTFTQRIELANTGSTEHGMIYLTYKMINNSGRPVSVRARVLFDTALGEQDYATYEVVDRNNSYRRIETETVITTADYIPANFFAYDDINTPEITAYQVNDSASMPYQAAFGHWNNLAQTIFDFVPDSSLNFTSSLNKPYQTADSAYALYYDMGQIAAGSESDKLATWYGVYSNERVTATNKATVNVTAPTALELNSDKSAYLSAVDGMPEGVFSLQAQVSNIVSETADNYDQAAVAIYTENGITPLDSFGNELGYTTSFQDPYTVKYQNFKIGQTQTTRFYLRADVGNEASFRKIQVKVFSLPETAQGMLLQENLLGSASFYVLCPGGNGQLPAVTFTSSEPEIIYNAETRKLHLSGNNFNLLEDKTRYTLMAYLNYNSQDLQTGAASYSSVYTIPSENISFPETNCMDVIIEDTMPPGDYTFVFEWIDPPAGVPASLTAEALKIVQTDNKAFKNDYYGIVAVAQIKNGQYNNCEYEIRTYSSEEQFAADQTNLLETLLVFRGDFNVDQKLDGKPVSLTAISSKSLNSTGEYDVSNPININNCLDFEGGNVRIYYDGIGSGRSVCVDFDGELLTAQERSSVWQGYAAFTEIKNGTDYGLIPYNSSGERLTGFSQTVISLIWPSGLSIAQTIGGMIFNLSYGEMGIMYGNNEAGAEPSSIMQIPGNYPVEGGVLSFSASLDLSFLLPDKSKTQEEKNWDAMQEWMNTPDQNGVLLRDHWNGLEFNRNLIGDDPEPEAKAEKTAKVMVRDILYGCGHGYIGFNCEVEVALPGYVEAMPTMKGKLSINTIGGWALGVQGELKFTTIQMEFDIGLISYNNIPIPDKLYFYISGFEPGINVDGHGVLWITGGGGGFSDLYKTIFVSCGVPPLKLMLSVSFDILKVLSARTDLALSLRGLSLTARDVSLKATNVKILNRATLAFEWYPAFNFTAAISADILGVIKGSGYIVIVNNDVYQNFVEFFIRAMIGIPEGIPIVGGITIGGVDLGVNNEKIWGVLQVIGIKLGITYYWGGDVKYGSGAGSISGPTFPELLNIVDEESAGLIEDVPVYTDPDSGQTLYMRVGHNLRQSTKTRLVREIGTKAQLADGNSSVLGTKPQLLGSAQADVRSQIDKLRHEIELTAYTGSDVVFTLSYSAADLTSAQQLADQITIQDLALAPAYDYALTLYDAAANDGNGNAGSANANLTYDQENGLANLAVTMNMAAFFDRTWTIETPISTDLTLFDVDPLPSVESVELLDGNQPPASIGNGELSANAGSAISVQINGVQLRELSNVSFYLMDQATWQPASASPEDAGIFIGSVEAAELSQIDPAAVSTTANLQLPEDITAGTYILRAVYSSDGLSSGSLTAGGTVSISNSDQPAAVNQISISNGGDLTIDVAANDSLNDNLTDINGAAFCDGYILNVYEYDSSTGTRTLTDINNMTKPKIPDENGDLAMPDLSIGGSYNGLVPDANAISAGSLNGNGSGLSEEDFSTVSYGLTAGITYQIGVIPYNEVFSPDGQTLQYTVNGQEVYSNPLELRESTTPEINFENLSSYAVIPREQWSTDENGTQILETTDIDTFRTNSITIKIASDVDIAGTWQLDDGKISDTVGSLPDQTGTNGGQTFAGVNSFTIALSELSEGDHTIMFYGQDGEGDTFSVNRTFAIDTKAPQLLLSSPEPGSYFASDGTIKVSGLSDAQARFTIWSDDSIQILEQTIEEIGGTIDSEGRFSFDLQLDSAVSEHELTISVTDLAGNSSQISRSVRNIGLTQLSDVRIASINNITISDPDAFVSSALAADASTLTSRNSDDNGIKLMALSNGASWQDISNANIIVDTTSPTTAQLILLGKTSTGNEFILTGSSLVDWELTAVQGSAEFNNNVLNIKPGSYGFINAKLLVADGTGISSSITFGSEQLALAAPVDPVEPADPNDPSNTDDPNSPSDPTDPNNPSDKGDSGDSTGNDNKQDIGPIVKTFEKNLQAAMIIAILALLTGALWLMIRRRLKGRKIAKQESQ